MGWEGGRRVCLGTGIGAGGVLVSVRVEARVGMMKEGARLEVEGEGGLRRLGEGARGVIDEAMVDVDKDVWVRVSGGADGGLFVIQDGEWGSESELCVGSAGDL